MLKAEWRGELADTPGRFLTILISPLPVVSFCFYAAYAIMFVAGAILAGRDADQVEGWQSSPAVEIAKKRTLAYQQRTTSENILNPEEKADLVTRKSS